MIGLALGVGWSRMEVFRESLQWMIALLNRGLGEGLEFLLRYGFLRATPEGWEAPLGLAVVVLLGAVVFKWGRIARSSATGQNPDFFIKIQ